MSDGLPTPGDFIVTNGRNTDGPVTHMLTTWVDVALLCGVGGCGRQTKMISIMRGREAKGWSGTRRDHQDMC